MTVWALIDGMENTACHVFTSVVGRLTFTWRDVLHLRKDQRIASRQTRQQIEE